MRHTFDVTVESPRGHWSGKTIGLSPSGAKVTLAGNSVKLPERTVVKLQIALPDGTPPLSLPARVMETDSDGVSVSFFNLRDQAQRLKDLLDSHQSGSDGSPNSERPVSTRSSIEPEERSVPPAFVEETRPAEGVASPNGAGDRKPEVVEKLEPAEPEKRSLPPSDVRAEETRLQELLGQAGLNGLCLPSNGVLTPQWRKFLEQFGPKASSGSSGSRSSRPARAEGSNVATGRGDRSRTSRQ